MNTYTLSYVFCFQTAACIPEGGRVSYDSQTPTQQKKEKKEKKTVHACAHILIYRKKPRKKLIK